MPPFPGVKTTTPAPLGAIAATPEVPKGLGLANTLCELGGIGTSKDDATGVASLLILTKSVTADVFVTRMLSASFTTREDGTLEVLTALTLTDCPVVLEITGTNGITFAAISVSEKEGAFAPPSKLCSQHSLQECITYRHVACPSDETDHCILIYRKTIWIQRNHISPRVRTPKQILRVDEVHLC
jgi:hypothetical protein